jgi:hypothetical protein
MSTRRGSLIVLLAMVCSAAAAATPMAADAAPKPPVTGFEDRGGASWTTHAEELAFLRAVDRLSPRTKISAIGSSELGRPMHLVRIGYPEPKGADAARTKPVALFLCSQHGNEPAPREGCLQMLRTLAFTSDPATLQLLETWTVLFIPSANPDGRAANTRENADGVDVNRDHLNLSSREARVISTVLRDWRPDVAVDHHEFGPGIPVLYDDDLLYLWPRNLNVDPQVHALSKTLAIDYIGAAGRARGVHRGRVRPLRRRRPGRDADGRRRGRGHPPEHRGAPAHDRDPRRVESRHAPVTGRSPRRQRSEHPPGRQSSAHDAGDAALPARAAADRHHGDERGPRTQGT